MKSMTGYGKGQSESAGLELTVEIKSVNNRFLEINSRTPKMFLFTETSARAQISKRLSRGSLDVYFNYRNTSSGDKSVKLDVGAARQYLAAAKEAESLGLQNDLTVTSLLRMPDALKEDDAQIPDETKAELVRVALDGALDSLIAAREKEGCALKRDLAAITDGIRERVGVITERAPAIAKDYEDKLRRNMQEVLASAPIDENRVLNEVAAFIDKADTNEEIQRLTAHLDTFRGLLDSGEPVGRQLEFISQEMVREANTLGTKCSDLATVNMILEIKNEIEKLKEQTRNAE